MKTRNLVLSGAVVIALIACAMPWRSPSAAAQSAPGQAAAKLKIGVYDSRAVAIAYVSSKANNAAIADLQRQLKEAEAANDAAKAAQVKEQGSKLQDLRHLQGFSNAPVDDILATIKDKLPAIAKGAGVEIIVSRIDFQGPAIETVDVTDKLAAEFQPSEKTLKSIEGIRKVPPYPMIQILGMKD